MSSTFPSRVGRYEILRELGAGGMGVVYLASDPLLRRTVAIKVLPGDGDRDLRERFLREARSVAALRHPNVVTIHDIGEEQGRLFIAMERIEGESMAEAISSQATYSLERRLQLMLELCAGLGYAHKHDIIHRDIKPGNLMITTDGQLKVLDFGLARLATANSETGLTRSGALVGTPNYMSPEQVQGDPVDHRTDIFAVGLVLYELLSYRRAYTGESIHTILHNIVYKDPTPIESLVPEIDPWLVAVIDKALQKDPVRRYASLAHLAADLERVLARIRGTAGEATVRLDQGDTAIIEPPAETIAAGAPPSRPPTQRRASPVANPSRQKMWVAAMAAAAIVAIAVSVLIVRQQGQDPAAAPVRAEQLPPPPVDSRVADPAAPEPAPATDAAAPTQLVSVDVLPWARVRIVPIGHTAAVPAEPLLTPFSLPLAPGVYRLECENGGVSPRTVIPITVEAGKPLAVIRSMQGFNAAQLVDTLLGPRQ